MQQALHSKPNHSLHPRVRTYIGLSASVGASPNEYTGRQVAAACSKALRVLAVPLTACMAMVALDPVAVVSMVKVQAPARASEVVCSGRHLAGAGLEGTGEGRAVMHGLA